MNMLFTQLKDIQPYIAGLLFVIIYLAEHIIPQRRDLSDYKHSHRKIISPFPAFHIEIHYNILRPLTKGP